MENLPPSRITRRLLDAAEQIEQQDQPDSLDFLHSILCQVGMPRKATPERVFERTSGNATIRLEAGAVFHRGKFIEQPLPYGTKPRLVMVHISSKAVKTKSPTIDLGHSVSEFLDRLGIESSGGPRGGYTLFRKQMEALAACRLTLGYSQGDQDVTLNSQPIQRFDAWTRPDSKGQMSIWPGMLELSPAFFTSLTEHAVPLDHTALAALQHSALALDIYTWLAHRLYRVNKVQGNKVSWMNMQEQFGQEYKDLRDFKKEFKHLLLQVLRVYPQAKVEIITGGMILKPSPPPVARKQYVL